MERRGCGSSEECGRDVVLAEKFEATALATVVAMGNPPRRAGMV
jgi:hypothetical protein